MTTHANGGDWPLLNPVPPEFPDIGPNPSPRDLLLAYARVVTAFGHLWPRTVQALEWLHHWTIAHDRAHGATGGDMGPAPHGPGGSQMVPPALHDPDRSWHEWDADMMNAMRVLSARVKNARDPMDSERARAIAKDVYTTIAKDSELGTWRRVKSLAWMFGKEVLKALIPTLVGGGSVLWYFLHR